MRDRCVDRAGRVPYHTRDDDLKNECVEDDVAQNEEDQPDGFRPNEEVGVKDCDAVMSECEQSQQDLQDESDGHEEGTFREEVSEAFPVEQMSYVVSPDDGLPMADDIPGEIPFAPSHTRSNCVCVEDESAWVELFDDEVAQLDRKAVDSVRRVMRPKIQEPPKASWTNLGRLRELNGSRYDTDGDPVEREVCIDGAGMKILPLFGLDVVVVTNGYLFVRLRRERCRYYKRQCYFMQRIVTLEGKGGKKIARNCTIRRSIGGAFLSVSDEAIYACDYRDPPDEYSTEKYLDAPDRVRLDSGDPEMVPLFGGAGGIFASKK